MSHAGYMNEFIEKILQVDKMVEYILFDEHRMDFNLHKNLFEIYTFITIELNLMY